MMHMFTEFQRPWIVIVEKLPNTFIIWEIKAKAYSKLHQPNIRQHESQISNK